MDDDSNNLQNQNNEQQEEKSVVDELGQKTKNKAKDMTWNTIKKGIITVITTIGTSIMSILTPVIIIAVIIAVLIMTLLSFFVSQDDMNTEGGAEFWFPIAKEDIYDQYFVDGDKEAGALIPYEDSSTDKVRTVITSPMGPRNRNADNYTITWEEFNALSSAEQENYHRPGHTVQGDQHAGIDIGSAKLITGDQTEIIASQSGTVTAAGNFNDGYGNQVQITSDPSYPQESMTRYAHMSEILVSEGTHVNQGQVIGIIGNTGGPYGIHLHFEIWQDGIAIDPRSKIEWDNPWRVGGINATADEALLAYIKAWEGHEGLSEDGTKYRIGSVKGNRTVGYGIDLETSGLEPLFIQAGYDTSLGAYVDVEFVDKMTMMELNNWKQVVLKETTSCNPPLNDEQINALTAISYQWGYALDRYNFTALYNQYGNTESLRTSFYPFSHGPESNGRSEANWKLFHEGIYTDQSGNQIVVVSSSSSNGDVNTMLKEAARIANDNSYYYYWSGTGPKGYDCSGFTQYLYRTYLGINLPRTANEQASYMSAYRIPVSQAQPGDLLWHDDHVAIYYGNGQSVEAMGTQWGICFGNSSRFTYAYSLSKYFANH